MELETLDVVVVEGEKLHLNIPYKAIPMPKMVWQKDLVLCIVEVKDDPRLSMTLEMNSAHLELLKCTHTDAGVYALSLENSLGVATGIVNVKVIGKMFSYSSHTFIYTRFLRVKLEHGTNPPAHWYLASLP